MQKTKKSISIINQTNQIPNKCKFKLHEFHIWLIRDYLEIRLGIELNCFVLFDCIWSLDYMCLFGLFQTLRF